MRGGVCGKFFNNLVLRSNIIKKKILALVQKAFVFVKFLSFDIKYMQFFLLTQQERKLADF